MRIIKPELFELFNPKKSLSAIKHLIDFFDHIQRGMNPDADPHRWPHCITTNLDMEQLRGRLLELGFHLDYPFQHYKEQTLSGHLFYDDGHQLHLRAFHLDSGGFALMAHYEWGAEKYPLRHLACKDLSYPRGCKMLKKLWNRKVKKDT